MEDVLVALIQGLIEVVLEVLVYTPFGLARTASDRPAGQFGVLGAFGWLLGGALLGAASLLFVPHALVHSPHGRIAALCCAPFAVGAFGWLLAVSLPARRRGDPVTRFGTAFLFSLGFTAVRFAFAHR